MLRDVEELSASETAAALELTEHNVKVRLHRVARWHVAGFLRVWEKHKKCIPIHGRPLRPGCSGRFQAAGSWQIH